MHNDNYNNKIYTLLLLFNIYNFWSTFNIFKNLFDQDIFIGTWK
jgi:hypothetical protein